MTATLRALLHDIIDYAGLFPPAELPLDVAIRAFADYRRSPEAWMLARFVCPVGRLAELDPLLDGLVRDEETFRFSVLPRGGADAPAFLSALTEDLRTIAAFRERHGARVEVDALEARMPAALVAGADVEAIRQLLDAAAARIDAGGPPSLAPFYETAATEPARALSAVVSALGAHGRDRRTGGAAPGAGGAGTRAGVAGFKLRCGGATPAAFPPPEVVARLMAECRDHAVPMKFTAGLHHPLRHFNGGQQVTMHGFLNVFVAGVMAWSQKLPAARIQQILEDDSLGGFAFDEGRLSWKGYTLPLEELAPLRAHAVTSFGSCSFDEPREDLRSLGLLTDD